MKAEKHPIESYNVTSYIRVGGSEFVFLTLGVGGSEFLNSSEFVIKCDREKMGCCVNNNCDDI